MQNCLCVAIQSFFIFILILAVVLPIIIVCEAVGIPLTLNKSLYQTGIKLMTV